MCYLFIEINLIEPFFCVHMHVSFEKRSLYRPTTEEKIQSNWAYTEKRTAKYRDGYVWLLLSFIGIVRTFHSILFASFFSWLSYRRLSVVTIHGYILHTLFLFCARISIFDYEIIENLDMGACKMEDTNKRIN